MSQNFDLMLTNGKMARSLGIDPKTLRKWAHKGLVPSYINRLNGYRYFFRHEVLKALKAVDGKAKKSIDRQRTGR